jgi:aspartate aminotransferase-like enzyme
VFSGLIEARVGPLTLRRTALIFLKETPPMKLFIPGPVQVSDKTFAAFCKPMMGHRSGDFKKLYGGIQPRLQELFQTSQPVFLSTSSAWGVMEGAIRNLVGTGKVLNCMCGAFSDKWLDVSKRCGKDAVALQVEWGQPIRGEQIRQYLKQGGFDAVTLIHNETSTGVMSPIAEIAEVMREFPEVQLIVDSVSSFSVVPIAMDELGIDVLLTGSQKALAMPPGLALFAASKKVYVELVSIDTCVKNVECSHCFPAALISGSKTNKTLLLHAIKHL